MALKTFEKTFLRALGHSLKPVVIIGQNGLTENTLIEIDNALKFHELIKVRFNASERSIRQDMIRSAALSSNAEIIQSIGNVAVFYRHNPKKTKIRLPKKAQFSTWQVDLDSL